MHSNPSKRLPEVQLPGRSWLWSILSALYLVTPAAAQREVRAPAAAALPAASEMQVRLYDVADLVGGEDDLTEGWLGDADHGRGTGNRPGGMGGMGGMGGGGMGGGGMGGGGMGGGGMMRVPPHIQPQFGDAGPGMGGGMGTGRMGVGLAGMSAAPRERTPTLTELIELVEAMTAGGQARWENRDGEGGTIQPVGNSILAIRQTSAVHQRISQLFDQLREELRPAPGLIVDLRLLKMSAEQAASFEASDADAIQAMANDPSVMRVHLRCINHRVARIAAGIRRSYVVSVVPVVGGELSAMRAQSETGYQPITMMPLVGLYGGILPSLDRPDPQAAGSSAGSEPVSTATLNLGLVLASGPDETRSVTYGSGLTIDRMELKVAKLTTQLKAEAGVWTSPGTVPLVDGTENLTQGDLLEHLAVFVRWKLAE